MADPELNAGHRPEIAKRTQGHTVAARAAAIQRRRRNARTILVHEPGLGGAAETDPGSQIDGVRDPDP